LCYRHDTAEGSPLLFFRSLDPIKMSNVLRHTVVFNVAFGAIKNTLDGHPNWAVPRDFARSVAKRVAGTLAGMHPGEALAVGRRSGQRERFTRIVSAPSVPTGRQKGAACAEEMDARLLRFCQASIERRIAHAKKTSDHSRYIELCTAARIIKRELKLVAQASDGTPS
jgi:hypothetical protein